MRAFLRQVWWLVWGLGLVVLVVAFYLLIYMPKTNEAATLTRQLIAERVDMVRLRNEARRERALEREIADLGVAVGSLDAKLPLGREVPALLLQLDERAARAGVTTTSLKPGTLEAVTVPPAVPTRPPRAGERGAVSGTPASPGRTPGAAPFGTTGYRRVLIDLETTGTFSATMKFIRGLEDFPQFLVLSDMRLTLPASQSDENPSDPVLTLAVTAMVYVRPESEAIP